MHKLKTMQQALSDLAQIVWSAEQQAALVSLLAYAHTNLWLPLNVPTWEVWTSALQQALVDSSGACTSTGTFLFLTIRPVIFLIWILSKAISLWIWKHIIVEGISQQGVQCLVACAKRTYAFQRSLTPQQLAAQGGLVVCCFLLYKIQQFLMRKTYFKRAVAWTKMRWKKATQSIKRVRNAMTNVSWILKYCVGFTVYTNT